MCLSKVCHLKYFLGCSRPGLVAGAWVEQESDCRFCLGFEEVLGKALQHAASGIDGNLLGSVQTAMDRHPLALTVGTMNHQGQYGTRRRLAFNIEGFGAVELQRMACRPLLEL